MHWYNWFSWWRAGGCSKYVDNWNENIEKNCASSWSFTKNHNRMDSQQNTKIVVYVRTSFCPTNYGVQHLQILYTTPPSRPHALLKNRQSIWLFITAVGRDCTQWTRVCSRWSVANVFCVFVRLTHYHTAPDRCTELFFPTNGIHQTVPAAQRGILCTQ